MVQMEIMDLLVLENLDLVEEQQVEQLMDQFIPYIQTVFFLPLKDFIKTSI